VPPNSTRSGISPFDLQNPITTRMDGKRTAYRLLLAVAALTAWAPPGDCRAMAADASPQPRLVHRFDFEERQLGNFEDLPRHWNPIGRKTQNPDAFRTVPLHSEMEAVSGYPAFSKVGFDTSQKVSGEYSFYLGLDGGNTGAFLEAGTVPAVPGSDYRVAAMVRTTPLRYAQAVVTVYFINREGRRIESSTVRSDPVQTDAQWQSINLHLSGDHKEAASIGIQLQLLQPEPPKESPLGAHQVVYQDVHGGAWFDDIAIWQVPRVAVGTQSPVNIIVAPDKPELHLNVHDLSLRGLGAEVSIYDEAGKLVDRRRHELEGTDQDTWTWAPAISRFGWYAVDIRVLETPQPTGPAPGLEIARARTALAYMPADTLIDAADRTRFNLDSEGLPEAQVSLLPAVLDATGLRAATVSCWEAGTTLEAISQRQTRLDSLLRKISENGRQITVSLVPVPDQLAKAADIAPDNPLALFGGGQQAWRPYLAPLMLRQGQNVQRWQVGAAGRPRAFSARDLPAILASVDRDFHNLAPQPRLVVPWRLDRPRRGDVKTDVIYALDVPADVKPEAVSQRVMEWLGAAGGKPEFTLHLHPSGGPGMTPTKQVEDLVLRMLYCWESGAAGMAMEAVRDSGGDTDAWWPGPALTAFAGVARRLEGRRVVGWLELGPGLSCMVLDGRAGGMLAAWNRAPGGGQAAVDLYLGGRPQAVDIWGNRAAMPEGAGHHRLTLGPMPLFVEGIDAKLALFRAGIVMDPAFLESTQAPTACALTLTNPWSHTLSGTVTLTQPRDWRMEPRRSHFSIAPGQSVQLPLEIGLPVSETAGHKQLIARMDFTADEHYVLDVAVPIELGLRNVKFDATLALEKNAAGGTTDAIVTQVVTNTGTEALSLYTFAALPGYPRQERVIPQLEAGQSAVRKFRFVGAGADLGETKVRTGLRETGGPTVLNKILSLSKTAGE
jgi:hypothetical protein